MEYLIDIPGRLHSVAVEKHIAGADQIYDDVLKTTLDILNLENITDVKVQDGKLQFLNIQGLVLKEISIASEQKQSDWNLTDSTQVDFIKNKPTVYNKLEVDDKLITKQDTIDDLATIRSGAQAGATAYQKPATGIPATDLASDVQTGLAAIDNIEAVIPEQASSSNQLADKNFVNSSIATATATYRGAFNLVTDLSLTILATHTDIATALVTVILIADNNDYCFVQIPVADATPTEISSVERYKYNGTVWTYEYTLNNSGYTAAQWEALNSGITSGLVAKLSALPTNSELTTLLNGKANTSDLTNYYQKSETYTKGEVDSKLVPATTTTLGLVKLYNTNGTNKSGLLVQQDGSLSVNVPTSTTDNNGIYRDDEGQLKANIKAAATNAEIEAGTSTEKAITPSNLNKVKQSFNLATVATSGSYNDLGDKPAIPTKTSDLTNDSGFLTAHQDISGKANKIIVPGDVHILPKVANDTSVIVSSGPWFKKDGEWYLYNKTNGIYFTTNYEGTLEFTMRAKDNNNIAGRVYINDILYYEQLISDIVCTTSIPVSVNDSIRLDIANGSAAMREWYIESLSITEPSSTKDLSDVEEEIPTKTSDLTNDSGFLTQHQDITGKADKVSNATNGNFAALDSNGNLIDSGHKHSDYLTQHQDLTNYVQKSQTAGLLKNDGTVDTTQYLTQHQDISGKEDTSNKVTAWQATPDDTHYPSEKLVKDSIDAVDEVFMATVGVTTYQQVVYASNAGKTVVAKLNNGDTNRWYLTQIGNPMIFMGLRQIGGLRLLDLRTLTSDSGWSDSNVSLGNIERTTNKTTTITGNEASNTYYPTTKAVADYAQKNMEMIAASGTTLSAVAGNYYRLDNVGTLAITLPTITGATKLQAITFLLACGSSVLVTFAPQGSETILYQEDFALEADTTYEVTALWNGSEWTLSRVIYE